MSALSLSGMPDRVKVCEMGPRDGLQNESEIVATSDKVRFIDMLSASGLAVIETTSFVRPDAIPQLTDAEEVMARIDRRPGVTYLCLTPNARGLDRARAAVVRAVAVFTAASETFNRKNINASIAESIERFRPVLASVRARAAGAAAREVDASGTDILDRSGCIRPARRVPRAG